jgi:pyruvate dehydrogenase E2 component (dihydrolipoamide acetyltransferase)
MTTKILMPALSPTMIEGTINNWLVKIGDKVKAGDIIAEIETDKATMEVEAVDEGVITHLLEANPDKSVPVNSVIALIDGGEKDVITNDLEKKENTNNELIKPSSSNSEKNNISKKDFKINEKIIASPFAKSFAKKNNINLKSLEGTGPEGRIIKRDINNFKSREKTDTILIKYKNINPSNIRNIIAKRTSTTKQQVPHFYLTIESNVDKLIALRNKINENNNFKISFNDILVKALALAMYKNSQTNVSWIDGKIYQYSSIDVSVAVALEDGLITPIVKDADKKGLKEISLEINDLVKKAHENKLLPEEYTGGSISISNLGMYGITEFAAIINPPQSSILAIGTIKETPIVEKEIVIVGHTLKSTLSADHRVLDGAIAGKLLKDFNDIIENPFDIWIESNDLEII